MKFSIITAFPEMFAPLKESIVKRAAEKGEVEINMINLLDYGIGKWKKIDDRPFGGGAGMLLTVEPIYKALKELGVYPEKKEDTKIILMSARGTTWNQSHALSYTKKYKHVVLLCGHYEGVDQRVIDNLIDEEVAVGNYILSGGELPAMIVTDSIVRLLSNVLGNEESIEEETEFLDSGEKIIEYPHYTRPEVFETDEGETWGTPSILLSGNHAEIEKWKQSKKEKKTI